ncbi:MAG TPA: POTRA domain-containing protein [Bryobacteraceae bacterium]|nr:POTRA domain-containing protein [Bryobacteraceae bacterium]
MNLVRALSGYVPLALLLLAFASSPLRAQVQKFEGKNVASIQFDPERQPLEPAELSALLPLRLQAPLRAADIHDSIQRLFATGRYADIQVDVTPVGDGVAVTFLTTNAWFVGDVSVSGAVDSPPNAAQLANASRLDLGAPFSESRLQDALNSQRALLESNGLYGAKITPSLDYKTDAAFEQVNIRFDVESGRRAVFGPPVFQGDLKMDPAKVTAATKFRRWLIHTWKPVTQTRLRNGMGGVRRLYQKADRYEASVTLDSLPYDSNTNRATPTFRIDAGPRIRLNAVGAKLSRKELQTYVPVFQEHSVDHDLLTEGARRLTDYLQSQGYFDAQVQYARQPTAGDMAVIDYQIDAGDRHKLTHIGISGNKYFDAETIRERMLLRTASFLQFPHGRYSASLLSRDEASIVSLYQSNGFRDVKVTHRIVDTYRGRRDTIAVFLDIEEGPQYLVGSLQVDGMEHVDRSTVLGQLSSVTGQPFSEANIAADRDVILARYFAQGFPGATFEWSMTPGAQANRVDVRYRINEGQPQFVRQVVVTGLRLTRPALVDRSLELQPGDPLSPTAIGDTQRRLYDLGVFAKVDAAIQDPDGDTTSKYVLYDLEEARPYSVAAGFGAQLGRIGGCDTCLDAPAGTTGFSPRVSFDVTRSNLWGVAHSVSLRTRVSTIDQRAILTYSWPRFLRRDSLNLSFTSLFEYSKDVVTFNSKREEASAQVSQRLSKTFTLLYRFTYRQVAVSDLKVTQFLIGQLSQPVRVGMPSLNLVQDRRDDPIEPHRGVYSTLDVGLSERIFGSQRSFLRVLARNSSYYPLGKKLVLARNTELGVIHALNYECPPGDSACVLNSIPLPERFFGGGGTSMRGFAENQAGQRDTGSGFPLGGTALLFNQTELRFPLFGSDIGGVLFHDFGNIFSSLNGFSFRTGQNGLQDFNYMVHAVGLGLRYKTPVGPVRADLAYVVNPPYFYGFNGTPQQLLNAGLNPCPPNAPNQCSVQNSGHVQFFISIGQTF